MQIEQEVIQTIDEFPRYSISNLGRVFNNHTGREMKLCRNQIGVVTVGLMRQQGLVNVQVTKSVKSLVAKAFVPGETELFDTPVLLDGNRNNLHADNIVWRPRWFALRYTRQVNDPKEWYLEGPIVDVTDNYEYQCYAHAASTLGVLCTDIRKSIYEHKPVFPIWHQFRWLNTH